MLSCSDAPVMMCLLSCVVIGSVWTVSAINGLERCSLNNSFFVSAPFLGIFEFEFNW